jgi:PAS domain S-box-containing protein
LAGSGPNSMPGDPETDAYVHELEKRLAKLEKINAVLIRNAERQTQAEHSAFDLFKSASVLEEKVNERTARLKEVQAQLRESLSLMRATLDSTADGILAIDLQGNVLDFNDKFIKLWGIPPEIMELREQRLEHICGQLKDPEAFVGRIDDLVRDLNAEAYDELHLKDGRIFERFSVPRRIGGETTGRVYSFRDITERRQAEATLARYNAELERRVEERTVELRLARDAAEAANRAKSAFLAIMGHELRTPLNGIFLAAEMLREHGRPATKHEEYVEVILVSGRRLLQMVEGVLEYTASDDKKADFQPLDVPTVFQDLSARFYSRAAQKHIALGFNLAPNLQAPLRADAHQVDKMLRRLLDNALKYTPEGGQITVAAQLVSAADVPPGGGEWPRAGRAQPSKFILQISVTDTGSGLRPEDCQRIFEPFVQLEASYLVHAEGVGLGLTLARRQAEVQGGRLWAESGGEGKGSTFILQLPLA